MIRVGVIGYGYWGPNLVRNFAEADDSEIAAVSDLRNDRLSAAKKRYPTIETVNDYSDLINDPRIDAVAVATPVSGHFRLAMEALQAGKHVLVEKPLAATSEQALRLIDEAEKRKLVLMVDHTFVYTSSVRKIAELIENNELGELYYYDSVRINLGQFQHDVNVLWDLAVHDLSIMEYALSRRPVAVRATGMSHVAGKPENIAYLTLYFDDNLLGHIHVNWLAPVKVRLTLISGSAKMIVFDDLEPTEKVKVYDRGVTVDNSDEREYQLLVGYRMGDMWAPMLDNAEALKTEVEHFIRCVEGKEAPLTDGKSGWRVVRILEAATSSLSDHGKIVELDI